MKSFENLCETCPLRQTDTYINKTGDTSRAAYPRIKSLAAARFLCRAERGLSDTCPTAQEAVENALESLREAEALRMRAVLLQGAAVACHEVQKRIMGTFLRGWSRQVIEQDNTARLFIGLPTDRREESIPSAYIKLLNGDATHIEIVYEQLGQKFDEPAVELVQGAVQKRLDQYMEHNEKSREAWAPPAELTFAAFCLDDPNFGNGYDLSPHISKLTQEQAVGQV